MTLKTSLTALPLACACVGAMAGPMRMTDMPGGEGPPFQSMKGPVDAVKADPTAVDVAGRRVADDRTVAAGFELNVAPAR